MNRSILAGATFACALVLVSDAWSASPPQSIDTAAPADNPLTLAPPKAGRARHLVVVLAGNSGAETTDFVVPYGILKESGAADVLSVSSRPGIVHLVRALTVRADETMAEFDASVPAGADIVIVPAMIDHDDPAVIAWLKAQYAKGATMVSICEGARILARAGLLDGKSATTHWDALDELAEAYPTTHWLRDRRYVQDGRIITTAGVTASVPASLALVEGIAGTSAAAATAARVGAKGWSSRHVSAAFSLAFGDYALGAWNVLAFWQHEVVEAPVADGVDEIRLALETDAWARTFRSRVVSTNPNGTEVRSRHGLRIVPEARPAAHSYVLPQYPGGSVAGLDGALSDIRRRLGPSTHRLVRMGLEYSR